MDRYLPSVIRRVCSDFVARSGRKPTGRGQTKRGGARHEALEPRQMLSVTPQLSGVPNWKQQGPYVIEGSSGISGMENQGNPVSGAVQKILTHPTDSNVLLVGSVNGGIWKTTNGTWSPNDGVDNNSNGQVDEVSETPTWKQVGSDLMSLSISDLSFDPLDTTNKTIIASTGALSSTWEGGQNGVLYRSTDGGETWKQISVLPRTEEGSRPVSSFVATGVSTKNGSLDQKKATQILLAGTRSPQDQDGYKGGLFRSADAGASWTMVSGVAGSGLPAGPISSIVRDPVVSGRIYAAIGGFFPTDEASAPPVLNKGIYVSNDAGATWTKISNGITGLGAARRILIAAHSSNNGNIKVLYAGVINTDGVLDKVYQSSDGGANWLSIGTAPAVNAGSRQGSLHFGLAAHPTDPNLVYVTGDAMADGTASVFVGHRLANSWVQLTGSGANGTSPHADGRSIAFSADGQNLYRSDDGGVFRLRNFTQSGRKWESLNRGLNITEVTYDVDYDPINRVVVAGTQDNGSISQTSANSNVWKQEFGGDGNYQEVVIGKDSAGNEISFRYLMANNFGTYAGGGAFSWTLKNLYGTSGGNANVQISGGPLTLDKPNLQGLTLSGLLNEDLRGFRRIPFVVNPEDPSRVFFAGQYLHESVDFGDTLQNLNVPDADAGYYYSALATKYVGTSELLYAAKAGTIHRGLKSPGGEFKWVDYSIPGAKYITDIVIDPSNPDVAYAVDYGHQIYATADQGQTWHPILGVLDGLGAHPRSIEVISTGGNGRILVAGTDMGVWRADVSSLGNVIGGASTVKWRRMAGIGNVAVVDLDYTPALYDAGGVRRTAPDGTPLGDVLVVGTRGQGIYTLENAATELAAPTVLKLNSDSAGDTVVISVNPDKPNLLQFSINGVEQSALQMPLNAYDRIEFYGNGGADKLIVDGRVANPGAAGGIKFDGGANSDDIEVKGMVQRPEANATNGTYTAFDGSRLQGIEVVSAETYANTQDPTALLSQLKAALNGVGDYLDGVSDKLLNQPLAGIGTTLGQALSGAREYPRSVSTPPAGGQQTGWYYSDAGTSIFARLLSQGATPLDLESIGNSITTPAQLRDALDALDTIPGNVVLTQSAGATRFAVQVQRRMEGEARVDVSGLDGTISLAGRVRIGADVKLNLVFGIDAKGFYIDPNASLQPELSISNIQSVGAVVADGRFGFLGVGLKDGGLTFDPTVTVAIDLKNPGIDPMLGTDDGVSRPNELATGLFNNATVDVNGTSPQADAVLTGTFFVSSVLPTIAAPFELAQAKVNLTWGNVTDISTLSLSVAPGAGSGAAQLIEYAKRGVSEVVSGLRSFAMSAKQLGKAGVLNVQVPLLGKTLGQILEENPAPVVLTNSGTTKLVKVSDAFIENSARKFELIYDGINLAKLGITAEDEVEVKTVGGGVLVGRVERVDGNRIVLRFATDTVALPDSVNPQVTIKRRGGFDKQLDGVLNSLNDLADVSLKLPTLQDILRELGEILGVDPSTIPVSYDGTTGSLIISPSITLSPMKFTRSLELASVVPGVQLDGQGKFDITVTPQLRLPIGIQIGGDASWENRVFLAADSQPELSVAIDAKLDDPTLSGRIGFLDLKGGEETPNQGIRFNSLVGVNLLSPTNDGKLRIKDLELPVSSWAGTSIHGTLDVEPIVLQPKAATATLGNLRLELNNYTINSLADLQNLPAALAGGLTGNLASYEDFKSLGASAAIDALNQIAQRLTQLGLGGLASQPLPLINKSVSELIDLGAEFAKKFGTTDGADLGKLATAEGVELYLEQKLGVPVTVKVTPGSVIFDFDFNAVVSKTLPLVLDLGGGKSVVGVDANGSLTLSATTTVDIGLGLLTGNGLSAADRTFLVTGPGSELAVSVKANVGYDTTGDGIADAAPFMATVNGFGKKFGIINGRALIDLTGAVDLSGGVNNDGKLTFAEIAIAAQGGSFAGVAAATFTGTAQALLPLDGNGDLSVSYPNVPTGADALVQIGGKLDKLFSGGVDVRTDPTGNAQLPRNGNAAIPLTVGQFDSNKFVVSVYNLSGFVNQGLLDFGTLFDGLESFLDFGDDLLGINLLDFKLPILGKTPREVFDFFSSNDVGSISQLVQKIKTDGAAAAAQQLGNDTVYTSALLLRNVLSTATGIFPIGDADNDGVVENNGEDLIRIDWTGAYSGLLVNGATFSQVSPGRYRINAPGTDFARSGVSYDNEVRYTASGLPLKGKVRSFGDGYLEFQADTLQLMPDAGTSVTVDRQAEVGGVTLLAKFKPIEYTKNLPFSLGLDFLDLHGDFNVAFKGNLEVMLGAGISKEDGFFIVTDFSDVPLSGLTASSPEISLNGKIEITGKGGVTLGFLNLDGTFNSINGQAQNYLQAQLGINFSGLGDNKLSISELTGGNFGQILKLDSTTDRGLQLNLKANLNIGLAAKINSDLPGLSTNFVLTWTDPTNPFAGFDPVKLKGVPTPYVALEDISLDAGTFLSKVAKPVFQQIDKYNVLKPVIDVMDDELPIIGKSLYDLLIVPLPEQTKKTAEFLFQLSKTISETASLANQAESQNLIFNFGDKVLLQAALPGESAVPPAGGQPFGAPPYPGQNLPLLGSYISQLGQIGITFPILDTTNLVQFLIGRDVDLVYVNLDPIVVQKSFNVTVPLFSYGIPYIADVYVEAFFGGGFEFRVELSAGLDTRGLRAGKSFLDGFYIGDFDPGANGIIDPSDSDRPEVSLDANVFAGINAGVRLFGFPVGKVTGQGTIGAEIGIDINDDNAAPDGTPYDTRSLADCTDGKLHLDEIETILAGVGGNPLCLFDLVGKLYARLDITATVDLLFTKIQKGWGQEWTLLDFSASCVPTPPDLANLVIVSGKPVLELTSTVGGDPRLSAASNSADNVQVILVDKNGIAEDGTTIVALPASGVTVTNSLSGYQIVSKNAGAQFKRRGLVEGQRVRYTTSGGQTAYGTVVLAGDDRFTMTLDAPNLTPAANTAFTVLSGKETLRVIKGHAQEDFGPGEKGANKIADISQITLIRHSGPLADFGDGDDIVFIDALIAANVDLGGGSGADRITAGSGGGTLRGGSGNDMLLAAVAPSDLTAAERAKRALRIEGGTGDDTIIGGPGDDVLLGGVGDDVIDAGGGQPTSDSLGNPYNATIGMSGNDTIVGGAGNDAIQGRDGDDMLVGDYDATFDPRPATGRAEGRDVIDAGTGNDRVWGDNRDASMTADGAEPSAKLNTNDTIVGGTGNDTIFGGSGHDDINGETGDDSLVGGSGNDLLQGMEGNDTILGGYGNDALLGGEGNNSMFGGWHDDVIRGGIGNDYVEGGPGDDSICTFDGVDTVYGGTALLGYALLGPEPVLKKVAGGFYEYDCDSVLIPNFVPTELTDEVSSVYGRVFNDLDADGIPDLGETGLSNWTVQLINADGVVVATTKTTSIDLDGSGTIDPSSEMGVYVFGDLPAGKYKVKVIAPTGWKAVKPVNGQTDVETASGETVAGVDFAYAKNAPLTGTKFYDSNGDGVRDAGEPGIAGITVYLDLNDNGQLDAGEPSAVTQSDNPATPEDESGRYTMPDVPAGTYKLREIVPVIGIPTTPGPVLVYSNDFSDSVGGEWTSPQNSGNSNGFLGAFGSGTATLNLTNLPAHSHVTIEFDLVILGSWDGTIGADAFLAAIRGQVPFLYATFANALAGQQSWPLPASSPYAGAISVGLLGYGTNPDGSPADAVYHIKYTLAHTSSQLLLDFAASGIEGFGGGDDMVVESYRFFGDFDGDRDVDATDATVFLASLNRRSPDPRYDIRADWDADGDVDGIDYAMFRANLGNKLAVPANPFTPTSAADGPLVASLAFEQSQTRGAVTAVFSRDVSGSLDVSDLKVLNLATGQYLPSGVMALVYDSKTNTATWTFPGLSNGGLSDGNYRFTLNADGLSDTTGNALDGNTDESFEAWGIDNVSVSLHGTSQEVVINGTTTANIGNSLYGGTVTGRVFNDANGNGKRDANETFLPGIELFADYNNNGVRDLNEPTTTTSLTDLGAYKFVSLPNGTYTIRPLPGIGLTVTTPSANGATVQITTGVHFNAGQMGLTGRTTATITGTVFLDQDRDGVQDAGETGISGAQVFADLNNDGIWNTGEPTTLTNSAGLYSLNTTAGPVTVRWLASRYAPTLPADASWSVTTTGPGTILSGIDFGAKIVGTANLTPQEAPTDYPAFHGFVFYDFNGNGIWDLTSAGVFEPRLDDWNINAFSLTSTNGNPLLSLITDSFDIDLDGVLEVPGELGSVAVYNSLLAAQITGLRFQLILKSGYQATTPTSVTLQRVAGRTAPFSFGVRPTTSGPRVGDLTGVKYNDLNGNGVRDTGELGLEGVTIYIDANNNDQLDTGEQSTVTATDDPSTLEDEGGRYTFTSLTLGTYIIREVIPTGYMQTSPINGVIPGAHLANFVPGTATSYDFGNIKLVYLTDGSDVINSGSGNDIVYGDNATDLPKWVIATGAGDLITSRDGDDILNGQDGNDSIFGGAGKDSLFGGLGDDLLLGEAGDDLLAGEVGNDSLIGGEGNDQLIGGMGDDTYIFADTSAASTDTLVEDTGEGNDTIDTRNITTNVLVDLRGQSGQIAQNITLLIKTSGGLDGSGNVENVLGSLKAKNVLYGNDIDNLLVGGSEDDTLDGGDGNDTLIGSSGSDLLTGGNDDDRIDGGLGADQLVGGLGNDTYVFFDNYGEDTVVELAGGGTDVMDFSLVTQNLSVSLGSTILVNDDDSSLMASDNIEEIRTGSGNDEFVFYPDPFKPIKLDGGLGRDTLNYSNYLGNVTVNLTTGTATATNGVSHIENVIGSTSGVNNLTGDSQDNLLVGGTAADILDGGAGADTLRAGGGNDTLTGGSGNDQLEGQEGDDTYMFGDGWGSDVVTDSTGADTLNFSAVSAPVVLSADGAVASGLNGVLFTGIETVIGAAGGGTVQARPAGSTFEITGPKSGKVDGLSFINFNSLQGGSGTDTVIAPNSATTFTLTGENQGQLTSGSILFAFSGIENLFGSAQDDTFQFSGEGRLTGLLDGRAGTDTVDLSGISDDVVVRLFNSTATRVGQFTNIESFVAPTGTSNAIIGTDAGAIFTLTGPNTGTVTGLQNGQPIAISYKNFGNLTGRSGDDIFKFKPTGSVSGQINGGPGFDTLDYSEYGAPFNVNIELGQATATGSIVNIENVTPGLPGGSPTGGINVVGTGGSGRQRNPESGQPRIASAPSRTPSFNVGQRVPPNGLTTGLALFARATPTTATRFLFSGSDLGISFE